MKYLTFIRHAESYRQAGPPPALMARSGWPKRVKSTTFTDPAGPLGESLGSPATWSIRESGKMEV